MKNKWFGHYSFTFQLTYSTPPMRSLCAKMTKHQLTRSPRQCAPPIAMTTAAVVCPVATGGRRLSAPRNMLAPKY